VLAIIAGKMRRTLGVFTNSMDTNSDLLHEGILTKARELDLDLLFFTEGMMQPVKSHILYYDLALGNIDGLIGGIFARNNILQRDDLLEFYRRFQVPIVTVNDRWNMVPSVIFDYRQGIRNTVTHFIREHGLRRILFVRGPEDQFDSEECYQAYCDTMREYGCYNPDLVSPALECLPHHYLPTKNQSKSEIVLRDYLLSFQPGRDFDAVIAVNDHWAIEAINILRSENYRVPEDVAVTGYNDSTRARISQPALTSVFLPFFEQGSASVDLLKQWFDGDLSSLCIQLPSDLLIRHSCGCWKPLAFKSSVQNDQNTGNNELFEMFQAALKSIFDQTELIELLAERLPLLGFDSFFLILYDRLEPYIYPQSLPEYSKLVMGYMRQRRFEIPEGGLKFLTHELLPDNLLNTEKPFAFIVAPLFFREQQFGYIMFETDSAAKKYYKFIYTQLNSSLWSIYLFEHQKRIEESLIHQTYELAYSNAELRKLAYVSSHDLQEPLRKIISFGDRLRQCSQGKLSPHEQQYLERIQYSAMRMHILINDLLDYYRIRAKNPPKKEINLSRICHELLEEDLEEEINRTNGKVEIWPLPVIKADPVQMRQVMFNLISNALKFHREDVKPLVIIYALSAAPGRALIAVDDNGIGINEAYYDKIFGVFERLHNQNDYDGSGIGLAICKKIIEQHGGRIFVDSKVGVGSKFMLDLPLC
jgi:signal transduction histidine kinase/DNA-binding LacI/PurR family transcriptional regulator